MLLDKYTPFTLNGLIGNISTIAKLNQFGIDAMSGKRVRPIMIYGPSGTGKTAAARAIAYGNGLEILELNSSDYRDSETLENRVMPASQTRGLFNKRILIIFDEIDELSAKFDSGAEKIVTQLVNRSKQPIIFTANDYWDRDIAFLRNHVEKAEFKRIATSDIVDYMKKIARKEGKVVSDEIVNEIAKRCNGDVRAALNDLEMMFDAKPELIESLAMRNRKMEIFGVLDKIFMSKNFDLARFAAASSDVEAGMLINWVDENVPNRYTSKSEIMDSYQSISKASMFFENATRSNYYGYLRYSSVLISSGVATANTGQITMLNNYSFPARIQYLSKVKKGKMALNEIALKLSVVMHTSRKDIIKSGIPMIYMMMKAAEKEGAGKEQIGEFAVHNLNLDEKDIETINEYYKFVM
jgi:replication factor C large subunit